MFLKFSETFCKKFQSGVKGQSPLRILRLQTKHILTRTPRYARSI